MPKPPDSRPPFFTNGDARLFKFIGIGLGCAFLAGLVLLGLVLFLS